MKPLLVVLNPRAIPEAIEPLRALEIDKVWLTGFTEQGLTAPLAEIARKATHNPLVVVSDDVVVTPQALDAVIRVQKATGYVTTGYCNLDETDTRVNLTTNELQPGPPQKGSYRFYERADLPEGLIPSTFAGMCLTAMPRGLWARYPIQPYGHPGYGSDYSLSYRLGRDGHKIIAPKAGFVHHLKAEWSEVDTTPGRGLLVGSVPPEVRYE